MERQLAWREGMLLFDGEPLSEVIAEVSRYAPIEIVLSSPALRDLRIGGFFRAGDTQALLNTLSTSSDVDVERVRPGLIYLRSASP